VLPLLGLEPIGGDPVMCCDARPMAIFSVAHWLVPIILLGFQRHVKKRASGCSQQCGSRDLNPGPVDGKSSAVNSQPPG